MVFTQLLIPNMLALLHGECLTVTSVEKEAERALLALAHAWQSH